MLPDIRPERRVRVDDQASEAVELTVPGGVPTPAIRIEVRPDDGPGPAALLQRLRDLREQGRPLALLAADPAAGAPLGFSPATQALAIEVTLPADRRAPEASDDVHVRPLDPTEAQALLPATHDRHRRAQIGQVQRSAQRWHDWFAGPPAGERRFLWAEAAGASGSTCGGTGGGTGGEGYLTYSTGPDGELVVDDLVTVTDRARRALWEAGLGLAVDPGPDAGRGPVSRLTAANLPVDEPLGWMLADPGACRVTGLRPFLHLRLLDVAAALTARRYNASDELVLELADPVLEANAGRYRLHGSPDGAACIRTQDPPDLSLSAAELAAAYLGGFDLTTLAGAGRVVEHRAGRLQRADAMFSWRPGPWTVTDW